MSGSPILTAVAPHWHDEDNVALLAQSWPRDERFELIVIDNGSAENPSAVQTDRTNVKVLDVERNLGFAAAVNLGAAKSAGPLLLILNTDARPESGALESLVRGMEEHRDAAGLAPRLVDEDGASQAGWQLRRLPNLLTLLGYCCFVEARALREPPAGSPVEQPAACALLLRRDAFDAAGRMDEAFWPAWFEDVDLARRLRERDLTIRYWPDATFRHGLGASVRRLGYGPFLLAYYRNLDRYARKHHGRGAALLLRTVLAGAALFRVLLLPLRCPQRARNRGDACAGLGRLAVAAASGWRNR
ncbi:MAG: glycosyltransferase family 2 protein [Acidobacteria bacterium]|nr:glycosyltransferase family 2 protein [Acidobacteriota bacterium]